MLREGSCRSKVIVDGEASDESTVGHGLREGAVPHVCAISDPVGIPIAVRFSLFNRSCPSGFPEVDNTYLYSAALS